MNKQPPKDSLQDKSPLRTRKKSFGFYAVVISGILAALFILSRNSIPGKYGAREGTQFRTEPVEKGDLTVTVTATGTLTPMDQVEVGVEVSGTIKTVEVDYNDHVKEGQILARLDTSKLEAQVLQSQAKLDLAQAKLKEAQADIKLAQSKLEQFKRARELTGGKSPSRIEMDEVEAQLARAMAAEMSAKAEIANAQAELEYNKVNLSKAIIRSPMDGIVLARKVEPGQTVAASLQTPILFIIARDLTEMELHADIDEADIGKVKPGQKATFTVDAYPNRVYEAEVKEIWLSPKINQGVVSYETVLYVRNPDGTLLPGMTATADIIVSKKKNVTLVPNAALRFRMPEKNKGGEDKGPQGGLLGMMLPRFPRGGSQSGESPTGRKASASEIYIWVLRNGTPQKCLITTGETDGEKTEVLSGDIKPGDKVIVGIMPSSKG